MIGQIFVTGSVPSAIRTTTFPADQLTFDSTELGGLRVANKQCIAVNTKRLEKEAFLCGTVLISPAVLLDRNHGAGHGILMPCD